MNILEQLSYLHKELYKVKTRQNIFDKFICDHPNFIGGGSGGGECCGAAGGGEANTSSNSGAGEGLALAKVGVDLPFKSITAGANITLTGSATELEIASSGGGGGGRVPFPIVEIVPEGVIGFPDIHTFLTASMKQDGWILPDGASASQINFRGYIPDTLNATPDMRITVMIITLGGPVAPAQDIHLRILGEYRNTGEDMDVIQNDVDISADITMSTVTEFVNYHEFNPATDPAPNDIFTFSINRDPANAGDGFTEDVLIFVKGMIEV